MSENLFTLEQTEMLDHPTAVKALQGLTTQSTSLSMLDSTARQRGYTPLTGPKAEGGFKQKYAVANPINPPTDMGGKPVKELEFELMLRSYEKKGSKDQAAVATVRLTAGGNTTQYDMLLEAPDGNFGDAHEFMVDNGQVVPANSWWTATRDCIFHNCGGPCLAAVIQCTGWWWGYFVCLAIRCGGCWVRCAACAGCNCSWWCGWAVGCCRQ